MWVTSRTACRSRRSRLRRGRDLQRPVRRLPWWRWWWRLRTPAQRRRSPAHLPRSLPAPRTTAWPVTCTGSPTAQPVQAEGLLVYGDPDRPGGAHAPGSYGQMAGFGNLSPEQLVAVVYHVRHVPAPTRSRRRRRAGAPRARRALPPDGGRGRHDLRRRHAAGDPGLGRRRPRQGRRVRRTRLGVTLPHSNRTSNSRAAGSGCRVRTGEHGTVDPCSPIPGASRATPPPSTISTFAGSSTTTLVGSIA